MQSFEECRALCAVVVPVFFRPEVPSEQVRSILESVFRDWQLFTDRGQLLAVADRGTEADRILSSPGHDSNLQGVRIHRLERNRGKAGAVAEGLQVLLETGDRPFMAARDCDGDHRLEDLPKLISLAHWMEDKTGNGLVTAMGARPSLEMPMGWVRQEWELFMNRVFVDLFQSRTILDKRFWGGLPPDIQSGYRVYSRGAARQSVDCLGEIPEDADILTFACESVPFARLSLAGGVFGQVERFTLVEQPVSSYAQVDLGVVYGKLLRYISEICRFSKEEVLGVVDNHLVGTSLFYSDEREALLSLRRRIDPNSAPPAHSPFL